MLIKSYVLLCVLYMYYRVYSKQQYYNVNIIITSALHKENGEKEKSKNLLKLPYW